MPRFSESTHLQQLSIPPCVSSPPVNPQAAAAAKEAELGALSKELEGATKARAQAQAAAAEGAGTLAKDLQAATKSAADANALVAKLRAELEARVGNAFAQSLYPAAFSADPEACVAAACTVL